MHTYMYMQVLTAEGLTLATPRDSQGELMWYITPTHTFNRPTKKTHYNTCTRPSDHCLKVYFDRCMMCILYLPWTNRLLTKCSWTLRRTPSILFSTQPATQPKAPLYHRVTPPAAIEDM